MMVFLQSLREWFRLSAMRGDRLLILVVFMAGLALGQVSIAWGHDRYDCVAAGEGTVAECQRHEWRHDHNSVGPWVLVVSVNVYGYNGKYLGEKQDITGTFATFDECLLALHRFGQPDITKTGASAWMPGQMAVCK